MANGVIIPSIQSGSVLYLETLEAWNVNLNSGVGIRPNQHYVGIFPRTSDKVLIITSATSDSSANLSLSFGGQYTVKGYGLVIAVEN